MADLHWRLFLEQWSEDILRYDHAYRQTLPDDIVSSGWLGYRSASEAQLLAAERRLRTTLPPSYRSFLAVTNGWRMTSPFIYQVWAVEHIEWTAVLDPGLVKIWVEGATPAQRRLPGESEGHEEKYIGSTLEISDWGDSAVYLLNPKVISPTGEWEAWFFANWGEGATVYPSFWDLMQAEHQRFLDLR